MKEEKDLQKSTHALREEEILKFWKENDILNKSLEKKENSKGNFVFFEGPPTANGKPGIHHLEARAFKDAIPRFKTMQGYYVRRKGGWDTHGLPVELQVEKELKLTSKKDIEKYGVALFNKKCKESVLTYLEDWGKFTERIGYFVDQENAYFTFHNTYIESLWNIVAKVNSDGLLYKDYKVIPWCPRCGTGLSSHELAQGYKDVKDLSVYSKFKVKGEENTFFLAWTTTPWTLLGNVALAVGEDIDYVKIKIGEEVLIISKSRLSVVSEVYKVLEEFKGKKLVGLEYEPLYPYLKENLKDDEKLKNAFKVYPADFVTTEDGTGIVHTAVMYGADDFELGTKVSLPKHHTVGEDGLFKDFCGEWKGRFVKDEAVAIDVIKDLAHRGLLFKKEKYEHSYPHCWRCDTPLIYFARDSWYIGMSKLRDKLLESNEKINWEPIFIKNGRFGEWLKDIKDWAISRERYWGTPLPVWLSEDGSEKLVVDSLETLKKHTKKSKNKYFLMRHGEATHNVKNVLSSDEEEKHYLTEKGKNDVKKTAESIKDKKIDLIIYSPLTRTKETAEIVAGVLGAPLEVDERIKEEVFDDLSGKPWSEIAKIYPTFNDRLYKKYKNAETLIEIKRRVGEFLYELEEKYQNKNILIVTHDGPAKLMKVVSLGLLDKEIEKEYDAGNVFLETGTVTELSFVKLPHDEEFRLDFHKPFIDEIELVSEKGTPLKRVKEVMDVWFDSGAMPFAQDHYPFQNKEEVDNNGFPADFISEAIDQTRGWFYTLHAVSNLMGKGNAYKNVICLGHLTKDGKKMSKSRGNIVDPWEMISKYGVDALRLWMYSVNQPGENKDFDEKTVDEIVKKVFNLTLNVLTFYELFRDKNLEKNETPKPKNVLDIWILEKLRNLINSGTKNLENFKLFEPVRSLKDFIDDLSTWYLRRSRDRLKDGDKESKETLYFVLKTLSKFMAPFAPFFAEFLYKSLRLENEPISVHLESWPELVYGEDYGVVEEMDKVRKVVSLGLEARQKANIKVRQPLRELRVKGYDLKVEYVELVKDEVNVKNVVFDKSLESEVLLDTEITEELKEEGEVRNIIREVQEKRKKENLTPENRINLTLDKKHSKLFENSALKEMLAKAVQADTLEFENGLESIKIEKI